MLVNGRHVTTSAIYLAATERDLWLCKVIQFPMSIAKASGIGVSSVDSKRS